MTSSPIWIKLSDKSNTDISGKTGTAPEERSYTGAFILTAVASQSSGTIHISEHTCEKPGTVRN
jgi:hypothetical protein